MKNDNSFHKFCESRMISKKTEEDFMNFFKKRMLMYFTISDEFVLNSIMQRIPVEHIQSYWHDYIEDLRKKIDNKIGGI